MTRIRFGLIGCGRISDRHVASLAKCDNAKLIALCDVRTDRMDAVEQQYRQLSNSKAEIARYPHFTELLEDSNVQTIIIATPSAHHADITKQAIAKGKHVMLEKPMALSLSDATEVVQLAQQHQVLVHVCHQLRYKPVMNRLKELIVSGALGHLYLGVVSMRLQRSMAYYEAAPWRGTWDQDGGMLLNQGIHLVDLLQWFMGDYEQVFGSMLRGPLPKQTEDVAAGIITFKNGAIGIIEANTLTYPSSYDNSITLFGDQGTVCIGGIQLNEVRKWVVGIDHSDIPSGNNAADEHLLMYEHVIQAIKGDTHSMVIPAAEGKKALEIVFALYDSVRTQQTVQTPLPAFSTLLMANLEEWK